jgi:hypothetical protein
MGAELRLRIANEGAMSAPTPSARRAGRRQLTPTKVMRLADDVFATDEKLEANDEKL